MGKKISWAANMTHSPLSPIFAEVADKMPSVSAIWIFSLGLATLFFAFRRISRWSFLVTVPLAGWIAVSGWREFAADTSFRQAVVAELGEGYVIQAVSASCIPLSSFDVEMPVIATPREVVAKFYC
jgi:hypothetical protein